jgi:hypothetical protein
MATPGLWGYGGNQSPGMFDYGLHAIKEGGKDEIKNDLGFVEGTALVLSNDRANEGDISRSARLLKEAEWLKADNSLEAPTTELGKLAYSATRMVPQYARTALVTYFGGPLTALGSMAIQSTGGDYNELTGMLSKAEADQKGWTREMLRERGIDYDQLPDQKISPERALAAGIGNAAISVPLEAFAYSKLLSILKSAKPVRSALEGSASEVTVEFMQQFPQDAAEIWAKTPGRSWDERVDNFKRNIDDTFKAGAEAAAAAGLFSLLAGGAGVAGNKMGRHTAQSDELPGQTEKSSANESGFEKEAAQTGPLEDTTVSQEANLPSNEDVQVAKDNIEPKQREGNEPQEERFAKRVIVEEQAAAELADRISTGNTVEKADTQSIPVADTVRNKVPLAADEDARAAKGSEGKQQEASGRQRTERLQEGDEDNSAREQAAAGRLAAREANANELGTAEWGARRIVQQTEPLSAPQQASMRRSLASAVQSGDYATATTIAGKLGMEKKAARYAGLARQSDGMTPFGVVERPRGVSAGRLAAREANAKEPGKAEWGARRIVQQTEPLSVAQQESMRRSLANAVQSGDYAATIARQLRMGKKAERYAGLAQQMTPLESYRQAVNGDSTAVAARYPVSLSVVERPRGVSEAYPVGQYQGGPGSQTGLGARFRAGEYGGARGVQAVEQVANRSARMASRQPEGYTARVMEGTGPKAIVREQAQYTGREVPVANHRLYKGNKETLDVAERDVVPVEYTGGNGGRLAEGRGEIGNGAVGRVGKARGSAGTRKAKGVRNARLAGKTHPVTGVPFDENGFPIFEVKFNAKLNSALHTATDRAQFKEATQQLNASIKKNPEISKQFSEEQLKDISKGRTPDGFIWHHHQDKGVMQLVVEKIHFETGHTGGRSIWGGGSESR